MAHGGECCGPGYASPAEAMKAPREKVKLPERQKRKGYKEPKYPYRFVAERF